MSVDPSSVRTVDDLRDFIKAHRKDVTDADLSSFIQDCKKYENSYPDMVKKEILNCVDAIVFAMETKATKLNTTIEEACTAKHFVYQIHEMVKKDVFKNKSVYNTSNESTNGATEKTPRDTNKLEIKMTEMMKRIYNTHKVAHPEFGKVLHSHNSHLNFDDAASVRRSDGPTVLIGNFQSKNFLNVKIKEMQQSFRNRLDVMQELLSNELKRVAGVNYILPLAEVKTFDEPTFLIGRLVYEAGEKDGEPKFSTDRVIMECLVRHETGNSVKVDKFPLNFTGLKQDYFLYPNMVIAVEVTGDLFIMEEDALKVHRIVEVGADKDVDPDSIPLLPTKFIQSKLTVLFFKGPYTIEGNNYFGGLNMIEKHIEFFKPQHVILAGPFIPPEQIKGELETSGYCHKEVRSKFIDSFVKFTKTKEVHVTIVQDLQESDNMFPIPVPYSMVDSEETQKDYNVTRVGSPCLLAFSNGLTVAVAAGNFQQNTRNLPIKNEKNPRYSQILKSFVSQHSLHSLFPGEQPFDVTQQSDLSLVETGLPTVWITPSTFTQFVREERGVVCVNPGSIFDGESFRSAVKIDSEHYQPNSGRMDEERSKGNHPNTRVEIIRF